MVATTANANPRGDWFSSIFLAFLAFVISFSALLFPFFLFIGVTNYEAGYWTVFHSVFWETGNQAYKYIPYLNHYIFFDQFTSFFASFFVGYFVYKTTTPPREIQLEGRRLLEGEEAIDKWYEQMGKEEEWGGEGILICETPNGDQLTISEDRETKHTIIMGGTGAGKTTILRPRIDAARERNDLVLVYDNKSDFTSTLPNGKDIILLAAWDKRGWAWNIAADCRNKADAEAFADSIIAANDKDPIWSNAARAILSAIIIRCQKQLPLKWGFSHIMRVMDSDAEIQATVKTFAPASYSLVADMHSKTTTSILVNLQSYLRPIATFATAFDDCPVPSRFSIRAWLNGETKQRTIIVQGNGAHESVQIALTQALISAIKREVTSPTFTDAKPHERRVNLFLDEFKQLGKLDGFATLLEVGRSKGVRLTIAIQDIHQLFDIYGKDVANTWLSSFGTYVVGTLQGLETIKYISEMFGRKRIRVYSPSFSDNGNGQLNRSDTYQEQDRAVFAPDEITRKLGTHESGGRLILFTGDDYIYVVDARHLSEEQIKPKRKATDPAAWTSADWPSPIDLAIANQLRAEQEQEDEE